MRHIVLGNDGTFGDVESCAECAEVDSRRDEAEGASCGAEGAIPVRRHVLPLAGVLCLCVGWPVLLAVITGSLTIPHNDAWAHAVIAQHYGRTGSIELVGWNRSGLVGQIVVLGPLGRSIIVQQLFVAVLASVGLLATYGLLLPRVGRRGAILGTVLVGVTPDFGLLATSYMADIPAFTAVVGCLFLTDQALRAQDPRYLLGALAVGTWGVTVREQAIVGPIVAVVVTAAAWRGGKRRTALIAGTVCALAILLFEVWRRSLPYDSGSRVMHIGDSLVFAFMTAVFGCFSLALAVFPAVLVSTRPRDWSRRARRMSASALVLGVLVVVAATAFRMESSIFLGNYLAQGGAYSAASIGMRSVLPDWWWFALVVMACVSFALIVGHFADSRMSLDRMFCLVLLLMVVGTLGQVVLGQLAFARYLLVLIPVACVALLGTRAADEHSLPRRCNWSLSLVALAVLAATSTAITANALAYDAARWQVASSLVARGVAATDIDAGFEWVGYHAREPASWSSAHAGAMGFYMPMFEHSRECYVVSASPLHDLPLVATAQYRTYALAGSSKLWVYQVSPCR